MTNHPPSTVVELKAAASKVFLVFLLLVCAARSGHAQGDIPSGTVAGSGTGPFSYSLSFSDAANATAPVGSIWYSWIPGFFFLPSTPTAASAPAGWTAFIDGQSIQFSANSPADDILPGQTLPGFSFDATFSPSDLAAAPNSGESVSYTAGILSDGGVTFDVVASPVPEPTPAILFILALPALLWCRKRGGQSASDIQKMR